MSNTRKPISADSGVVEFWKNLLDARIIFPIPQDFEDAELNALDSYFTIKDNQICLNKGVVTGSDGMLYDNGECTNMRLPSILIDCFGGMLCLPDDVFFLGDKDNGSRLLIRICYLQLCEIIEKNRKQGGPASNGCTITGIPSIGKTYFGLYLLFYIRYNYPNAIVIWQYNKKMCYQFSPDVDEQALTTKYKAYMILLTSKMECFNEAVKWPGFTQYFMPVWDQEEIITLWALQYKDKKNYEDKELTLELVGELLEKWGPIPRSVLLKWDDMTYQNKYDNLIATSDLKKCRNSIDKSGMPTDTNSGRLVHLDVNSDFTKVVYCFASSRVSHLMIHAYETKTKIDVRNFVASSHEHPMIARFRGNLFEYYAHLELQRGGKFRMRCLNDNSEVNEINIKEMKCNWFTTLNEACKEYYNRPKSKTFASVDSFSLDNKTLDLYQITVSENHGVKIKGLNDLNRLLEWIKDVDNINLYFVVPPNIFETFPLQKYKSAKGEDSKKIPKWISEKLTQYALEIDLDISNKSAKKRSSDAISGDNENEETTEKRTNKDEASGSKVISGQRNLKRSSNVIDNESEDESKSDVVKKRKQEIVEDEGGETIKKGKNKKDVKKRKKQ
ncbi:14649_t:CDS:2 [Cetraspora pellucida]|uniref:14649_t:CDS:1 n=1 Tax=Cetraspora pellucida TaxID=1433469 RepID=A0ACA9JZ48_9GLOM|nr:14649_t:CDS:2 [Cetraspora pellucida]